MNDRKPDAYDYCFGCEYLSTKSFAYFGEYVCTFNGDDDRTVLKRRIKKLDKCPKESEQDA